MANVLLAEDEAVIRKMLEQALGGWGHTVRSVRSGLEAIAALEVGPSPEVVITDYGMPEAGGDALIAHIQERGLGISVIVMSGGDNFREIEAKFGAGAFVYLAKPLNLEELKSIVEHFVRTRREHPLSS